MKRKPAWDPLDMPIVYGLMFMAVGAIVPSMVILVLSAFAGEGGLLALFVIMFKIGPAGAVAGLVAFFLCILMTFRTRR